MSTMGKSRKFDEAVDGAWREFRHELTGRLEGLDDGQVVCLEVAGEAAPGGCLPYVQFLGGPAGEVYAEVVSNHYLAPAHRLRRAQQRALREMGWGPVARRRDGEVVGRSNYWYDAARDDADWVALMAVRALREVFGVVDPSFLAGRGLEREEPPVDVDELRDRVRVVLDSMFGGTGEPDEDGDLPVRVEGRHVAYVRVTEHFVHVFAFLVHDAPVGAPTLLGAVNDMNRQWWGPSFNTVDPDVVAVTVTLEIDPLVPEHVEAAVGRFCAALDPWAEELFTVVGGRTALEPASAVRQPESGATDAGSEGTSGDGDQAGPASAGGAGGASVSPAQLEVDADDYMTCVVALEQLLEVGPLDSARVVALFDGSVRKLRAALSDVATSPDADAQLVEHLRRGLRRALRREVTRQHRPASRGK